MELKDIILKEGDIITYYLKSANETAKYAVRSNDDNSFDDEFLRCVDVLKIERPKYETIYEAPKEILDREEKEYLEHFLRPFKDKVKSICKFNIWVAGRYNELIRVIYQSIRDSEERLDLPEYKSGTMYKGMEPGKEYTPEELGLFKK